MGTGRAASGSHCPMQKSLTWRMALEHGEVCTRRVDGRCRARSRVGSIVLCGVDLQSAVAAVRATAKRRGEGGGHVTAVSVEIRCSIRAPQLSATTRRKARKSTAQLSG